MCLNILSNHKTYLRWRSTFYYNVSSSSSQRSLHLMQSAHSSRSEALDLSSGRWRFSDILLPYNILSNHGAVHQWLSSSPLSCARPAILLKLSAVAAEKILESMRGRSCGSPLRPLKDWTAPPSLSTDHWWVNSCSLINPNNLNEIFILNENITFFLVVTCKLSHWGNYHNYIINHLKLTLHFFLLWNHDKLKDKLFFAVHLQMLWGIKSSGTLTGSIFHSEGRCLSPRV